MIRKSHLISAAVLLCEELRRTGDSLKVRQIKERLIKLGFGEKFTAQPTFHYGLVYRLCHAKPPNSSGEAPNIRCHLSVPRKGKRRPWGPPSVTKRPWKV